MYDTVDEGRPALVIARSDVTEDEVGGVGPSGPPALGEDAGLDDVLEGQE